MIMTDHAVPKVHNKIMNYVHTYMYAYCMYMVCSYSYNVYRDTKPTSCVSRCILVTSFGISVNSIHCDPN